MENDYNFNKEEKRFERPSGPSQAKPEDGGLGEILRFAVIAIAIVLPIRILIAQPFIVSGTSMVPTFENGEYIIVDQLSYRLGEPVRGDVAIFKYPNDPNKYYIKRIIGLPGETVTIFGNKVTIINSENPDGIVLDEPYVKNLGPTEVNTTLAGDEYFVMGDNRSSSYDSRYWGPLKDQYVVGRAFIRLLPVSQIGILPGKTKY